MSSPIRTAITATSLANTAATAATNNADNQNGTAQNKAASTQVVQNRTSTNNSSTQQSAINAVMSRFSVPGALQGAAAGAMPGMMGMNPMAAMMGAGMGGALGGLGGGGSGGGGSSGSSRRRNGGGSSSTQEWNGNNSCTGPNCGVNPGAPGTNGSPTDRLFADSTTQETNQGAANGNANNKQVYAMTSMADIPQKGLAVVDVGYVGCPGCDASRPGFHELAKEKGDAATKFLNLDTQTQSQLLDSINGQLNRVGKGISTVPALLTFRDGKLISHYSGSQNPNSLNSTARNFINDPQSKQSAQSFREELKQKEVQEREAAKARTNDPAFKLIQSSKQDLLNTKNFDSKSLNALEKTLSEKGRSAITSDQKELLAQLDQVVKDKEVQSKLTSFGKQYTDLPDEYKAKIATLEKQNIPDKKLLEELQGMKKEHDANTALENTPLAGRNPNDMQVSKESKTTIGDKTYTEEQAKAAAKTVLNLTSQHGCMAGNCYAPDQLKQREGYEGYQHSSFTETSKQKLLDLAQRSGQGEAKWLDGPKEAGDKSSVTRHEISDEERQSLEGLDLKEITELGKQNIEEKPKPKAEEEEKTAE